MRSETHRIPGFVERILAHAPALLALLVLGGSSLATLGCEFLAGAAVGGAGGYIAGREAGEDKDDDDD